jgi:hypothetical protein
MSYILRGIYTPYTGAAGLLLHINGKFTMGKLKSTLLSWSFVLNHHITVNIEVKVKV